MTTVDSKQDTAPNLREFLAKNGYTLEWLMVAMGISKRVVNHIANSGRARFLEAYRISQLFGVELDMVWEILEESGRRPGKNEETKQVL